MNNKAPDDQSLRAWSMDNSLFSNNTASTAATSRSNHSQKLEMVAELEASENVRAPSPETQNTDLGRTSGSIVAAQHVPVASSNPLRPPQSPRSRAASPSVPAVPARSQTVQAPAPRLSPGAQLFGVPNMRLQAENRSLSSSPTSTSSANSLGVSTRKTLEELAPLVYRIFDSILVDPRPSALVTRAASVAQLLEDYSHRVEPDKVSTTNCEALVSVISTVLGLSDILLRSPNLRCSRFSLLHALALLGIALGLVEPDEETPSRVPRNFAMHPKAIHGSIGDALMAELATKPVSEEEGSYVAPVCRGLGPDFAVITLCIGIPHVYDSHWTQILALKQVCPELHFYLRQDCILPAQQRPPRVMPPFRTPDPAKPPISISLAPEGSTHASGTLGGYIYPIINEENSDFAEFKKSTFALTCGHVCLDNIDASRNIDKPVLSPSPVLVSLFRKALDKESRLHSENSYEYRAYRQATEELASNPPKSLGSLVWGEHDLVTTKLGQFMSDLAIISCDPSLTCRNDLGDDIELTQNDSGLAFERTVTHIVPPELLPGLNVFKYGATSRYTSGAISASRIVYWANNRMQSTEFVVRGDSSMFATGGDSGAWVLSRGAQIGNSGLGVAGMIHSYDGEFKEFGLFTPICSILERLEQVTSVPWAIVGVPRKDEELYSSASSYY